jgi:hypothetical protein
VVRNGRQPQRGAAALGGEVDPVLEGGSARTLWSPAATRSSCR